jgi:hypothetical protein
MFSTTHLKQNVADALPSNHPLLDGDDPHPYFKLILQWDKMHISQVSAIIAECIERKISTYVLTGLISRTFNKAHMPGYSLLVQNASSGKALGHPWVTPMP